MKKVFFLNVAALLCALAVFSSSAVYAAARMEKLPSVPLSSAGSSEPSEPASSGESSSAASIGVSSRAESGDSSLEESSEASSALSSIEQSSLPVSSAPVSSKPISSEAASSEETSSEPVSSEVTSSEPPVSSEIPEIEFVLPDPAPEQVVEWPTIEFIFDPSWLVSGGTEGSSSTSNSTGGGFEPEINDALLDMVAGAVQREIVGVNTVPDPQYYEAYKAQAVACHSYMEYHRLRTGNYPSMSYTTPHAKTVELVSQVLGELMYYDGNVINAAYHAASGGYTQSAVHVWGTDIPYLRGVVSAYDDYARSYTIPAANLQNLLSAYGLNPSANPADWFDLGSATYTDGGFVNTLRVCGTTISARNLREKILGASNLKSPKITDIRYDGSSFTFTTLGYGHGVGLSQLGALGYARYEGWNYRQILTHYYTGVTIR